MKIFFRIVVIGGGILLLLILAFTFFVVLPFLNFHFPKITGGTHYPNSYDQFFAEIAYFSKDFSICEKISPHAVTGGGFNPQGLQIISARSKCYASLKKCDLVHPINTWASDGSKFTAEYCRSNGDSYNQPSQLVADDDNRAKLMKELGYDLKQKGSDLMVYIDYTLVNSPEFLVNVKALPDQK